MRVGGVEWAFVARSVARIVGADEWDGRRAIELLDLAGLAWDPAEDRRRILLIRVGSDELPIRALGKIAIRSVDRGDILPLPSALLSGDTARCIGGVVIGDGGAPLFVLENAKLHARATALGAIDPASVGAPERGELP